MSRHRYFVLALLSSLAMITYMDRAASGSAKPEIMAELGITVNQFAYALMAFQIAYAVFEVPSGWLGDRFGPRGTLLRIVLWWSAFVGLYGLVAVQGLPAGIYLGFTALVIIQFLFGMGEAGAFPNISRGLYNWFPADERGFAKSVIWMSARLMGGLTPALWVVLTRYCGLNWHECLYLFAGVAAVWCLVFAATFVNRPSQSRFVSPAEVAEIDAGRGAAVAVGSVPFTKLLRSRNLLMICLMYLPCNFNWYFLMYFLPGVFKTQFADLAESKSGELVLGVLAGAPLLVGMFGCYLGGVLSDRHIRRTGDRRWGRSIYGMLGYGLAGVFYWFAAASQWLAPEQLIPLAVMLMCVGFANDLMMAPAWAVCQDCGREFAATVSGAMNMVGNLGAATGIFVTSRIIDFYAEDKPTAYTALFTLYGVVYFGGVWAWSRIDARKPIVPAEPDAVA